MRFKKQFLLVVLSTLFFVACEDDFLKRDPLTAITPDKFFKTARDLQIYANSFYGYLPRHSGFSGGTFDDDDNTDNQLPGNYNAGASYNTRWNGETTVPSSGGGYSWGSIRRINYFFSVLGDLKNSDNVDVKQYIGEAYFFRAFEYFKLLKRFGDLPWIDKPLEADINQTALSRISRKTIVENMVKDLDKAIDMMKDGTVGEYSRVNKHVALAFKARVCLYEGTWEKYHSGSTFGVSGSNGSSFIELARDAAKAIMDYGVYDLHADNGKILKDYGRFFSKADYGSNKEILFWGKMSVDRSLGHSINRYLTVGNGPQMTKQFVDACLMKNGKLPTAANGFAGYDGNFQVDLLGEDGNVVKDAAGNNLKVTRSNTLKDRDPRLVQSVFSIGDIFRLDQTDSGIFSRMGSFGFNENSKYTGYPLRKGANPEWEQFRDTQGTIGTILFRYAEVLLIYAEAQVELGNTAAAIAQIDKLRERVDMTKLSVAGVPTGSTLKEEVRRERRVELMAEGFRQDDIFRWKAATKYIDGLKPMGMKYTGNTWLETAFPNNDPDPDKNTGPDANFISTGGFIESYKGNLGSGYDGFDEGRDYLSPINSEDITLSKGKLKQNPGYDN